MTQTERELLLLLATVMDVVGNLDASWSRQLRDAIAAVERQKKEAEG